MKIVPLSLVLGVPVLLCGPTTSPEISPADNDQASRKPAAARTDLVGEPLPPGASARLGLLRLRHGGFVLAAAYAPDGKVLASFGKDECIRFWDPASGKQLHHSHLKLELLWFDGRQTLTFSGDGKVVALSARRSIVLVPTVAGEAPRYLPEHHDDIMGLVVAPGDRLLAVLGTEGDVSLVDTVSGRELRRLSGHTWKVWAGAFSPDGKTLATGAADGTVRLWRVDDGKQLHREITGALEVYGLAFAPDGRTLAWADTGSAAVAQGNMVHVWDVATRLQVASFPVCKGRPFDDVPIGTLRFTAAGTLEAWGTDPPTLCRWDPDKGLQRRAFEHLPGKAPDGRLAPDGTCAVCWAETSPVLRLLDLETGRERELAPGHWRTVSALAVSAGSPLVASAAGDDTVRLWDPRTGREVRRWQVDGIGWPSVAFAPDGKSLAACTWDGPDRMGTIRLWDVATGREQRRLRTEANRHLAFARDGRLLFTAGHCRVQGWDRARGELVREMEEVPEAKQPPLRLNDGPAFRWEARALAAAPDGKLVTAVFEQARSERFYLWDTATGKRVPGWTEKRLLAPIVFSPDGHTLAAVKHRLVNTRDYDLILWEVATGQERSRIPLKQQGCASLAFSPDGKVLAIGNLYDGAVHLWSIPDGKEIGCLRGPEGHVQVTFTQDGTGLISASGDATLLVWDWRRLASPLAK
jgi:WD40 repeat protein